MSDHPYESLVERLREMAAELDDLAYERLREQVRAPDGDGFAAAKAGEKRVQQARRAIAKAITALSGTDAP